jgi:hypothetical protein
MAKPGQEDEIREKAQAHVCGKPKKETEPAPEAAPDLPAAPPIGKSKKKKKEGRG